MYICIHIYTHRHVDIVLVTPKRKLSIVLFNLNNPVYMSNYMFDLTQNYTIFFFSFNLMLHKKLHLSETIGRSLFKAHSRQIEWQYKNCHK